jgi:hypothetical protein
MHQETGEIPLGRNYLLPRPPSGSGALQDRINLGRRRLGQSTSSVESSCGQDPWLSARLEPSSPLLPWSHPPMWHHRGAGGSRMSQPRGWWASCLTSSSWRWCQDGRPPSVVLPLAARRQLLTWPVIQGVCRASEPERSKRRWPTGATLRIVACPPELEPPLPGAWSLPPFGPGDQGCGMRETGL